MDPKFDYSSLYAYEMELRSSRKDEEENLSPRRGGAISLYLKEEMPTEPMHKGEKDSIDIQSLLICSESNTKMTNSPKNNSTRTREYNEILNTPKPVN